MKRVMDFDVEVTEGKVIGVNGDYTFICPVCEEETVIDDFDTAYYCVNCNNAIKFPCPE